SVEAGGYLVILMDEKDDKNGTDSFLHASFKLGTDTNCLMIYKGTETVLNAPLTRTELEFSVGQQGGATVYYTSPTPGQANASDNFQNETEALASLEHSVVVSEACAYQENGSDWVELCNVSQTPVSLNGWSISDKPLGKEEESTYTFGEISLNAGECLLLSSVDENGDGTLPFSLSADGDKIYLYDQEGNMKDFFTVAQAHAGHSCGRDLATGTTLFYDVPTPQQPNGTGYTGYAQLPELSNMGGYAQIGEKITAPMSQDMTIYYTDDGTVPTQESQVFTEYTLNGNQVLRFYVVQAGLLPSEVTAVTYITDAVHDVPIVCLSSDPYGLYSDEEGILVDGGKGDYEFPYRGANFWQDWEREVSFEYYLPDGSRELFCNAGAKVHGQYSRAYPQKSIALYFRSKYNTSEVHYPFFDENNPVTDFSSILLRATGQDHSGARIRDAFVAETAEEYSDLLHMDWKPICVYINGQYQGQYNLREKISADHIKNHEGIQKENLDLVKDNDEVKSGSREDFSAILRYMEEHDMSTQESYEYVASKIDIDNYIDYLITEIFFANEDGGSNNKHYRDSENGKWRWILYDVDMSMGMTQDCTEVNGFNTLKDIFSPSGNGAEAFYVSGLQRGLTQNSTYMQKFISRYAELLNTSFMPDKLSARLDEMTAKMDAEMKLHQLSYSPSYEEWKES
ncbi:MAG: CotH kinase family protein, partial [Oscillospiraceae bacterium]|nr:CotH kinase family protein [Oscillospiraceae bacterium]